MNYKEELRKKAFKIRKSIKEDDRNKKSAIILNKLESLDIFKNAKSIFTYCSVNSEVDTIFLIKKYISKKKIYIPKISDKSNMEAVFIEDFNELVVSKFGILGIKNEEYNNISNNFDLVLLPVLALDLKGNRIGMGKGYYDKYFTLYNNFPKLALAYEKQVLDYIEKDSYDVPVDFILTEKKLYNCNTKN